MKTIKNPFFAKNHNFFKNCYFIEDHSADRKLQIDG